MAPEAPARCENYALHDPQTFSCVEGISEPVGGSWRARGVEDGV